MYDAELGLSYTRDRFGERVPYVQSGGVLGTITATKIRSEGTDPDPESSSPGSLALPTNPDARLATQTPFGFVFSEPLSGPAPEGAAVYDECTGLSYARPGSGAPVPFVLQGGALGTNTTTAVRKEGTDPDESA
jgi:hypothetical protein